MFVVFGMNTIFYSCHICQRNISLHSIYKCDRKLFSALSGIYTKRQFEWHLFTIFTRIFALARGWIWFFFCTFVTTSWIHFGCETVEWRQECDWSWGIPNICTRQHMCKIFVFRRISSLLLCAVHILETIRRCDINLGVAGEAKQNVWTWKICHYHWMGAASTWTHKLTSMTSIEQWSNAWVW